MEEELKAKFLSYPIPKEIVEEYNKIFKNKFQKINRRE